MSDLTDQARAVREGEALDTEATDAWLKSNLDGLQGTPEVTQYPAGASNLTYRLAYPGKDLILRRPPFGTKAKGAHDMGREVRVLRSLMGKYPVPAVLGYCQDESVMGADFYVMERLEGVILRTNIPDELGLDESRTRELCVNVFDRLVDLHQLDVSGTELAAMGKGEGYVRRQIDGWSARYRKAMTEDATDFERTMKWLDDNAPDDVANTVIHNDYRLDNVVLDPDDPTRIVGVLDWEMCTLGDPLMDLGNSLAYWLQADDPPEMQMMRRQPSNAPGMLTRREIIDAYGERMGFDVEDFDFYLVYGTFRLAVIVQQIYYRYFHGQTKDPRFAPFAALARILEERCHAILDARE
jgi:aminoglycoside phosphotransferase (APT) family kinase protein